MTILRELFRFSLYSLGHDWSKFIEYVVRDLEGDTTEDAVEKREKEMREKIREIIPCDATKDPFFSGEYQARQYDIVQSCTCLESVLDSREAYYRGIVKLASYVKPGGYLQILTAAGASWYSFAGMDHNLYVLNVEAEDGIKGMEMAGELCMNSACVATVRPLQVCSCPMKPLQRKLSNSGMKF